MVRIQAVQFSNLDSFDSIWPYSWPCPHLAEFQAASTLRLAIGGLWTLVAALLGRGDMSMIGATKMGLSCYQHLSEDPTTVPDLLQLVWKVVSPSTHKTMESGVGEVNIGNLAVWKPLTPSGCLASSFSPQVI